MARINGDHIDAMHTLYADKAVSVASNASRLFTYSVVTFISVVIPLAMGIKPEGDVYKALAYMTVAFAIVIWPNSMYLKLKYHEYNHKYKQLIVRNIINHAYCSSDSSTCGDLDAFLNHSRDMICKHVMYATGWDEAEVNALVGRVKGDAFCMRVYRD